MNPRTIQTEYFSPTDSKTPVRINRASSPQHAVMLAVGHMQMNDYSAAVAVVFDTGTAELHAIIKHYADGSIRILFKRDPRTPTCIMLPLPGEKD